MANENMRSFSDELENVKASLKTYLNNAAAHITVCGYLCGLENSHNREVDELRKLLKEAFEIICDDCENENCENCVRNMKFRKAIEGER